MNVSSSPHCTGKIAWDYEINAWHRRKNHVYSQQGWEVTCFFVGLIVLAALNSTLNWLILISSNHKPLLAATPSLCISKCFPFYYTSKHIPKSSYSSKLGQSPIPFSTSCRLIFFYLEDSKNFKEWKEAVRKRNKTETTFGYQYQAHGALSPSSVISQVCDLRKITPIHSDAFSLYENDHASLHEIMYVKYLNSYSDHDGCLIYFLASILTFKRLDRNPPIEGIFMLACIHSACISEYLWYHRCLPG